MVEIDNGGIAICWRFALNPTSNLVYVGCCVGSLYEFTAANHRAIVISGLLLYLDSGGRRVCIKEIDCLGNDAMLVWEWWILGVGTSGGVGDPLGAGERDLEEQLEDLSRVGLRVIVEPSVEALLICNKVLHHTGRYLARMRPRSGLKLAPPMEAFNIRDSIYVLAKSESNDAELFLFLDRSPVLIRLPGLRSCPLSRRELTAGLAEAIVTDRHVLVDDCEL
jgi:hypothetical protein